MREKDEIKIPKKKYSQWEKVETEKERQQKNRNIKVDIKDSYAYIRSDKMKILEE